jgi:hypothetical protein
LATWTEATTYLSERGSAYGLSATELINRTPDSIHSDPDALLAFWQAKDISHILPTSTHPQLAGDPSNVFPEDPGPNRARQDAIASPLDQLTAWADNQLDAIKALLHLPVG